METHNKNGIWTQHQDASGWSNHRLMRDGPSSFFSSFFAQRTFYFNMVHGRSFWEIPDELKAQVKQPAIDTLDDWEPAFRPHGAHHSVGDNETRKRREQVMQHAAANASTGNFPPGMTTLHERMAQAAQRKKETEMKKFTKEKQRDEDKSGAMQHAGSSNEYLDMVRQLQHVDKETDSTGGKWLVR